MLVEDTISKISSPGSDVALRFLFFCFLILNLLNMLFSSFQIFLRSSLSLGKFSGSIVIMFAIWLSCQRFHCLLFFNVLESIFSCFWSFPLNIGERKYSRLFGQIISSSFFDAQRSHLFLTHSDLSFDGRD